MSAEKLKSKEAEVSGNDIIDEPPKTYSEHIKELKEAQGTLPTSDIEDTSQNDEEKQKQIDEMRLKVLEQAKKPDDTPEDERANIELVKFGVVDIPRELLGEDKVLVDEIKHRNKFDVLGRAMDKRNLQKLLNDYYKNDKEIAKLFSPTVAGLFVEKLKKEPELAFYQHGRIFEALPLETQQKEASRKEICSKLGVYSTRIKSFDNKLASGLVANLETAQNEQEKITEDDFKVIFSRGWNVDNRRIAPSLSKNVSRRLFQETEKLNLNKLDSALTFLSDEDLFDNLDYLAQDERITVKQVRGVKGIIERVIEESESEDNIEKWQDRYKNAFAPELLRVADIKTSISYKYNNLTIDGAKTIVQELDRTNDIRKKIGLSEFLWCDLKMNSPTIYQQVIAAGGLESDAARKLNTFVVSGLSRASGDSIKTIEDVMNLDKVLLSAAKESLANNPDAARYYMSYYVFGLSSTELEKSLISLGVAEASHLSPDKLYPGNKLKLKSLESLGDLSPDEKKLVLDAIALLSCGDSKLKPKLANYEKHQSSSDDGRKLAEILDKAVAKKREEISKSYSHFMQERLSSNTELVDEKEYDGKKIPVYNMSGNDFMLLVHRLGAYYKKDRENPAQWNSNDGLSELQKDIGYISTSAIAHNALRLANIKSDEIGNEDEVFYSFSKLGDKSILSMCEVDSYTKVTEKMRGYDVVKDIDTASYTYFYDKPSDLIKKTASHSDAEHDGFENYNETVLDRYSGSPDQHGGRLQPSEIIVFTDDPSKIGDLPKKHAAYFGIPIIMINPKKHK